MADTKQRGSPIQRPAEWGLTAKVPRVSGALVLWALVVMFVAAPFLDMIEMGRIIESALLTIVFSTAVLAVGADRRSVIITLACAAPAIAARWVTVLHPDVLAEEFHLGGEIICVAYVTWRFLVFITRVKRVDPNVLCTGVAAFLMLALLWALVYGILDRLLPGSFSGQLGGEGGKQMAGFTALYFSLVTLCTVGFGDITPVSEPARMLAMFEGMAGVFFVAIMVSRLVSMYSAPRSEPRDESGAE